MEKEKLQVLSDELEAVVRDIIERVHLRQLIHSNDTLFTDDIALFEISADARLQDIYDTIVKEPLWIFARSQNNTRVAAARTLGRNDGLVWPDDQPPRTLNDAVGELRKRHAVKIVLLKALLTKLRLARDCQDALTAHLATVVAAGVLARAPKLKRPNVAEEDAKGSAHVYRTIDALDEGISLTTRRAVDTNGLVQRPAETLIRALDTLTPWSEGARGWGSGLGQTKSVVPDSMIAEIALATEVAARDFVQLLLDHVETCWRAEVQPRLPPLPPSAEGVDDSKNAPAHVRGRFPLKTLQDFIHKSCDDLDRRLRNDGIAAYVGPPPPRLRPLELVKTAVRYPMQLAALAFLALPLLAVLGYVQESASPGAILKGASSVLFPLLAVFAFWQAFTACRVSKEATLDDARRHLRSETGKTLKEVGDAIAKEMSAFLRKESERLKTELFAIAQDDRRRARESRLQHWAAVRAAAASRLKVLSELQQRLSGVIEKAEDLVHKTLAELQKILDPPARGRSATDSSKASNKSAA